MGIPRLGLLLGLEWIASVPVAVLVERKMTGISIPIF